MLLRIRQDGPVRGLDRFAHPGFPGTLVPRNSRSPGCLEVPGNGLDRQGTGHLASLGPAHTIRDDIESNEFTPGHCALPVLRDQHGVFVMVAHLADVGEPGRAHPGALTQRQ